MYCLVFLFESPGNPSNLSLTGEQMGMELWLIFDPSLYRVSGEGRTFERPLEGQNKKRREYVEDGQRI